MSGRSVSVNEDLRPSINPNIAAISKNLFKTGV